METKWVDINDVPYVNGWHCTRSTQVSVEGVGTLITLTLQDSADNLFMFVMPLELAQRIGWDMMGEGAGFYQELGVWTGSEDS